MPDIVYNLKIKLDGEVERVKDQLKELDTMSRGVGAGSASGGGTQRQTNAVKQYTDAIRKQTSELNKQRALFREFQRTKRIDAKSTQAMANVLEKKTQKVRESISSLQMQARALELSESEQVQLNNAVTASRNAFITADKSLQNYNINLRMMGKQAGANNKTFAGANQALFSFSDLVQDSAQFSQGFAQGMRAIGNNVGFTAELLINMNRHAKAANMTMGQALMQSMKGAAGALIILNVAITATTVLLDVFRKRSKEAKEEVGEFEGAINDVVGVASSLGDVLGVQGEQILPLVADQVRANVSEYKTLQSALESVESKMSDIRAADRGTVAGGILSEQDVNRLNAFEQVRRDITDAIESQEGANGILNSVSEDELKLIDERIGKYIEERNVRNALRELINQQITDTQRLQMVERARASVMLEESAPKMIDAIEMVVDFGNQSFDSLSQSIQGVNFDMGNLAFPQGSIGNIKKQISELRSNLDFLQPSDSAGIRAITDEIERLQAILGKTGETADKTFKWTRQSAADLASALSFIAQSIFGDSKAAATANAIIQTYGAANRALNSAPPPFNYGLAAAVVAAGLNNVRKIQQTQIGGSVPSGGSGASSGVNITPSTPTPPAPQPTFIPPNTTSTQAPVFIITNKLDRKGLATIVREGEQEILSTQV